MAKNKFSNQLISIFISYANLDFEPRFELKGLSENNTIIALGLNTLAEELSHQTVLSQSQLTLILNLLDLIITNKSEKEVEELATAIKRLLEKNLLVNKNIYKPNIVSDTNSIKLSSKELLVAKYIALELTNKEIGEKIGINQRTVESVRSRIISKLGVKNSIGIVKYALKTGLIS